MAIWVFKEIGVTSGLLILFVAVFFGWIRSPLTESYAILQGHTRATAELVESISRMVQVTVNANTQQIQLLRELCLQRAGSPEERRACLR